MAKQKKENIQEAIDSLKESPVLGFAARHPEHDDYEKFMVKIPAAMFLNMLGAIESLNHAMYLVKEEHIANGTFKWYTEKDLEEVKDENGNPVLDKSGNPMKKIRDDFWD